MIDVTGIPAEAGQHIRLIEMPNDPDPVPAGATGYISNVVEMGLLSQLWVVWEEPYETRTLCLVGSDRYEVIEDDQEDSPLCGICGVRRPAHGMTACSTCA